MVCLDIFFSIFRCLARAQVPARLGKVTDRKIMLSLVEGIDLRAGMKRVELSAGR